ncbi:uncharacterized protein BX664DRAFT_347635 [Halteromyces radiatus]|uniref:uncharacterized protein n=1 Tax=Halteromyces radiatus TaxID=101107 RepID=UPI00222094E4|nr:uncharacterized protein BX664DRAFT_347635 [Halteromyces radiatus]KAI8097675.1 hypothetical protein BX664DRAFT_347635 [Halteromyces radiatus]
MHSLLNKRHWVPRSNSVTPIPNNKESRLGHKHEPTGTTCSSVKNLIPSLSTFNLPPSLPNHVVNSASSLCSPCSSNTTTILSDIGSTQPLEHNDTKIVEETPPPIFACDQQTAYPTTLDQYGSPDLQQYQLQQLGGIQPVKLLLERLEAWQYVTKCLYNHFEALALLESSVVKSYHKLENLLEFDQHGISSLKHNNNDNNHHRHHQRQSDIVEIKDNNDIGLSYGEESEQKNKSSPSSYSTIQHHFAKTGGIRQVCDAWQMYHLKNAKDHADYAAFIRTQGLPILAKIKHELKYIIRSVRSDDRLSLTVLAKMKDETAKRLTRLDQQLSFFDRHPDHGFTKEDPWLMNTRVITQMIKMYQQENKMHETVIRLQREIMALEKQLMDDLRHLCQQLYTLRESSWLGVDQGLQEIMRTFDSVVNDRDWCTFAEHCKDQLVSENASYRHPNKLVYPNHSHPLVQPLFAASMERKSSVLQNWHEYIYVLTPAGFLHEYRNKKTYPSHPTSTIFVPEYSVTTLSTNRHHDLIFQLQPYALAPSFPRINSTGSMDANGNSNGCKQSNHRFRRGTRPRKTITLRAKCAQDMQVWMEHLTLCSHRYRPMMQYPRPSVGDIGSSVAVSPTLVNQDITSPRWLLSPSPMSRATTTNLNTLATSSAIQSINNNINHHHHEAEEEEEDDQMSSIKNQQQQGTTTGFSVLADFISFASKQLATDQQGPSESKPDDPPTIVSPTPASTAETISEGSTEPNATRASILTGVQYP